MLGWEILKSLIAIQVFFLATRDKHFWRKLLKAFLKTKRGHELHDFVKK